MKLKFNFCSKRMETPLTIESPFFFDVIPINNADSFLLHDNDIFSLFEIIKRITCFSLFELCLETYVGYIFFLAYKVLRAVAILFFSIFFQSSSSNEKFKPA